MNRTSILSFLVVAAGIAALLATTANSQFGSPKAYVNLQPTSPGTSQSGHATLSGTVRAGSFAGDGAGVSNVNASQLGGLASTAFGRLGTANVWTAGNTFGGAGNSFTGVGTGLTGVNADLLDGINSTAFLQAVPNPLFLTGTNSQEIILGTNNSSASGASGITGSNFAASNNTCGVKGIALSVNGRGVYGVALSTSGLSVGVEGTTDSTSGFGIRGWASAETGATRGGYFSSSSTSGIGASGSVTATTGNTIGLIGQSSSVTGIGVAGAGSAVSGLTTGVHGEVNSPMGRGIFGNATSATGSTYGVFGVTASSTGRGVYGQSTAVTGVNFGVYGQSASSTGIGTFGWASATSGTNYGVVGESTSVGGRGVYGHALATSGATVGVYGTSHSTVGNGIFGEVIATTGTNYSVRGLQSASIDGWAVFASGDFGASGNKAFRIDHPFDPENKYLLHYASESPYPQNFYSGNVIIDSKGYAWVELPEYFEAVNANFKYQLTVIDTSDSEDFVWAKVVAEIQGNRFKIRSNKPGIKVSWRVEADRNDPYNQLRRPREVVEKQGIERGTYQHPEIYGMPPERGMDYGRSRANLTK